jgi:hypothetical protein
MRQERVGRRGPLTAQRSNFLNSLPLTAGNPSPGAGTDNNTGSTFILELELYQHSGIPAPAVLQIATINSARIMKDDREYGSLAVGKVADVIVVNGRPHERISDLRNIETVIRAGRVYDPKALRSAVLGTPAS